MASSTELPAPPAGIPKTTYEPQKYQGTKYHVTGYEYPDDLMSKRNEYGGNYVIFYINVSEESKMIKNKEVAVLSAADQQAVDKERIKKQLAGQEYNKNVVTGLLAAGGALGGTALGSIAGIAGRGGVIGALLGGTSGATVANEVQGPTFSRAQKRLQTAIALHIPNDLNIRYGVGWGEEETYGLQAGMELLNAGASIVGLKEGSNGGSQINSIVSSIAMQNVPGGKTLSAMSGVAPNPKKEQVFSGVDFRTFTLNYQFAPKSSEEAKNVLNIVNTFKYHMHPEYKDEKGFLFLYPSEFDIVYYHGAEENLNIHRHTSCVLTDLNINYTPNGIFNTFADGMPTQINMQMTFKELTILTKELIQQGL